MEFHRAFVGFGAGAAAGWGYRWILLVGVAVAATARVSRAQAPPPGGPGAAGGGSAAANLSRDLRYQELQQYELDMRQRADQDIPPGQRLLLDYGAYITYSYLSVDDPAHNNHGLREGDLYAYGRLNLDGAQEFFVRTRIGFRDFNNGDNFEAPNNYQSIGGDLDRGYYRIDLQKYNAAYGTNLLGGPGSDRNLVFEGGRDLTYWANGLVLAEVLDGISLDFSRGPLDLQIIAGVTPVRTVDFDTSRPAFYYNTRRGFYGAMLSSQIGDVRPFVYGVLERDYNERNVLKQGPLVTRYSYNSFYIGTGATGSAGDHLRYGLEAAYEGGNTLSNSFQTTGIGGVVPVDQTRDPIQAYALDARLDYLFNDSHQSRVGAEFILASGDSDRGNSSTTFGGNSPHTTDRAFNGFGLLNAGLAFSPEVSNLLVLRLGGNTFPLPQTQLFRRLQLGTDFFIIGKLQRHAPINELTGDHRYLGVEPDVYLNWQVSSDLTVALRYGVFVPGSRTFSRHEARQFFYATITYGF